MLPYRSPSICMVGPLFKIGQTPLSRHRMVNMEGFTPRPLTYILLRGFADSGHAINVTPGSERNPV